MKYLYTILAIFLTTAVWSKELTPRDLRVIPKPTLFKVLFAEYKVDRAATIVYYDKLFEGKTATEIVTFLNKNVRKIHYRDESKLSVTLVNFLGLFDYKIHLDFTFKDGFYESTSVGGAGIK